MYRPSVALWMALLIAVSVFAADHPDFSGSYKLAESNHKKMNGGSVLRVAQTADYIEVTAMEEGRSNTNKYPFGQGSGPYISPNGVTGTCKAKLKGKNLILESWTASRPSPSGPLVRVHTKQTWKLSSDLKKLNIHGDAEGTTPLLNMLLDLGSWTEVYSRQ